MTTVSGLGFASGSLEVTGSLEQAARRKTDDIREVSGAYDFIKSEVIS